MEMQMFTSVTMFHASTVEPPLGGIFSLFVNMLDNWRTAIAVNVYVKGELMKTKRSSVVYDKI